MNCKQIQELILTDYVDGQLTKELASQIETHIASCGNCKQFLQNVASITVEPLKNIETLQPPEEIWSYVKTHTLQNKKDGMHLKIFNGLLDIFHMPQMPKVAFAAALAGVILVVSVFFFQTPPASQNGISEYLEEQAEYLIYLSDGDSQDDLDVYDTDFNTVIEEGLM